MATSSFSNNATKVPMVLDTLTGQIRPLAPGEQISARFVEAPKFLNLGQIPPTVQLQKDYVELYQRLIGLEKKYCECIGEPTPVPCPECPDPEPCPEPEPCEECPPAGVVLAWHLLTDAELESGSYPLVNAREGAPGIIPETASQIYTPFLNEEILDVKGAHLAVNISQSSDIVGWVVPFIAEVRGDVDVSYWQVEWLVPSGYGWYGAFVEASVDFWETVLPTKQNNSYFCSWAEPYGNNLHVYIPAWGSGDQQAYAVGIFKAYDASDNILATFTMSGAFMGW